MNFTPKTEDQIAAEDLLPDGEYDFEVVTAIEKISKSNNPMIHLKLRVFAEDRTYFVDDYILESFPFKLRRFFESIGQIEIYNSGAVNAQDLAGMAGKVMLKTVKAREDKATGKEYPPKNDVKDYVKPGQESAAGNRAQAGPSAQPIGALKTPVAEDDDIPF